MGSDPIFISTYGVGAVPSSGRRGIVATALPEGHRMTGNDRRGFLQKAGLAGILSAMAPEVLGQSSGAFTVDPANTSMPEIKPTHSIRFAAIGLDHAHIFGMISAIQRGGGTLVAFHATDAAQIADFNKRYPGVKLASEDE